MFFKVQWFVITKLNFLLQKVSVAILDLVCLSTLLQVFDLWFCSQSIHWFSQDQQWCIFFHRLISSLFAFSKRQILHRSFETTKIILHSFYVSLRVFLMYLVPIFQFFLMFSLSSSLFGFIRLQSSLNFVNEDFLSFTTFLPSHRILSSSRRIMIFRHWS